MKNIFVKVCWKFLLAVFKIKRYVNRWFGMRRLDYQPKDIFILTDTIREYQTRARSVIKEPKTVTWIEKNKGSNAVFYDIGANVGAYSLIAAAQGIEVFSFEPAHQNIYKLHENIILNNLSGRITVIPIVCAAREGINKSFIKDKSFGATHSFSFQKEVIDISCSRTFLAMKLDNCMQVFSLPEPTMIKIDVDGAEVDVLVGAQKLLKNSKLKTLLIETEKGTAEQVRDICIDEGFRLIDEQKFNDRIDTINYIFERS